MDEYEVIPIDGWNADIGDVIPTEDEADDAVIEDEGYDPEEPVEPSAPDELPDGEVGDEPEPDSVGYPPDEDILPTEDGDDEIAIGDAEYDGGQEDEPDIIENVGEISIIGSARQGDVIPVVMRSGAPLGIAPAGWGDRMQSDVDIASQAATEAKAVAQATGQHFWEDSNGAHVTEITKDDWKAEEAKETPFADVSDSKPYHNLLMNSLGILLRTALKNLVSITRSAIAFFDGQGNDAANVVASFGKDGFQVGEAGESHMVGDYHSLQLVDKEGLGYFYVSDLRSREGVATVTDAFTGDGNARSFSLHHRAASTDYTVTLSDDSDGTVYVTEKRDTVVWFNSPPKNGATITVTYETESNRAKAYTLGVRGSEAIGPCSMAEGYSTVASGSYSHAEGIQTVASGYASHAEGSYFTKASGLYSHAEGYFTKATNNSSHAEGTETTASGNISHAEGYYATASGQSSHAEGSNTYAVGDNAHAEGRRSWAKGMHSHAQNLGTYAAADDQTTMGRWNAKDANGQHAVIIGNGTSDSARSNALTVGWDGSVNAAGDASIAGDVSAGGALSVTGDATMGGTLGVTGATTHESTIYVNGANVNNMWMRDEYANADYDGVPSSGANTTRTVGMIDSDDDQLARVSFRQRSDGRRCAGLEAHGFNSGGTGVWNSLWAVVDKAGNRSYEMSDPAAFREALRMRSGVVATRSVAAGSVTTVDITFSPALSSAPNVVCGLQSTQTQLMGSCSCVVTATSATGFTVALVNNSSSARNLGCYWIAM